MRNVFLPLAVIAAVGFGGVAMASNNAPTTATTGAILTVDPQGGSIFLADGSHYVVPATINLTSFNDTENVTVEWQQVGSSKVVTAVSHAQ